MLIRALTVLCLVAPMLLGQDADKKVWISINHEAVPGVKEALADRGHKAVTLDTLDGIAVLEVTEGMLPLVSQYMHHRFNICGGFRYHESPNEAFAFLDFEPPAARMVTYSIDNATSVNSMIGNIQEQPIIDTIVHLSSYFNRYYTTQDAVDSANWVKSQWESIAASRSDATAELFSHSWAMPSVIMTIEGSVHPDEVIVLGAHLDSINGGASGNAPGADDDASGIATITEILRVLVASEFVPDRTIKFMGYAAEEVGLRGSEAIAIDYSNNGVNVIGAINFDMTNYQGSTQDIWLIQDNTNAAQNTFVENLIDTYLPGVTRSTTSCGYACSDHASWHQQGFAATMPSEAKFGEHNQTLHTTGDTISVSNSRALHALKFARLGAAYIGELAKGGLGVCTPIAQADAGSDATICLGDSTTIGTAAQANTTYSWSPGGATTAQISVSPSSTTTYTVTATTSCGSRNDSVTITVDDGTGGGLDEDFEGDVSAWTTSGLWHVVNSSSCASPGYSSATHAFYYGQDSSCNYSTGAGTSGSLTSPDILGVAAGSTLSFDYYRVVESYSGAYDKTEVSVVTGSGSTVVWSRDSSDASTAAWQSSGNIDLSAYAGQNIQIRFTFDSIDSVSNTFTGWLVDDVVVTGSSNCNPGNTAPTVNITAPANGTSVTTGTSITFTGTANDAEDGDISTSISWSSNLDGALGTGASVNATLSIGTHTVTASATDSGSLTGSDSITVTVNPTPNTAPVVSITAPADGTTINSGDSLNFTGTANDAEDGDISSSISWSSNLDGSLGSGASTNATLSVGTHTVTASATDSGSLSGSDTITVTVNPTANTAPVVNITAPADGTTINSGDSLTFTGTANDAEDGDISSSISWSSSLDGALGSGASTSATLSVGTHTVTASATDSGSLNGSDTITVTVNPVTGQWTVVESTDFESGWASWIDGGTDCRRSANDSAYAHGGTYCVRLRDNTGVTSSMYANFNLSAYTELKINFWYMPVSMEGAEDLYVEVSNDGGSSWNTVGNYVNNVDFVNNQFENPEIIVTSIALTANTQIRVRCDASGNGDRIYVDDMVISAR